MAPLRKMTEAARAFDVLRRARLLPTSRPDLLAAMAVALRRYGPAAGTAVIAARRYGPAYALVDERGPLSYTELHRRSSALAGAWSERGLGPETVFAAVCRDHRGLIDTVLAAAKLGARLLLMNTGFGPAELTEVAAREGVTAVVHDQEFTALLDEVPERTARFLAWVDEEGSGTPSLDELIADGAGHGLSAPPRPGELVLLTSGTGGTPKGAPRSVRSPLAAAQFLERVPLGAGEPVFIAAPVFHGTGLSQLFLALSLGSTVVCRRRFDALATVEAVQRHRCGALVLVPTMLRRILDLGADTLARYDTSSLRIVLSAGSALGADLGNRATAAFGETLYNLYGSTEAAVATIATPEDWRAHPGTVGRPPTGCRVRLYDGQDEPVAESGQRGRIFVGSPLAFDGYTDGGRKESLDGLLATGDVGHFDERGRLFVDGRDDDMVVSGGENIFPAEIEELLAARPDVIEAAVIGVPDEEFGWRLRAFVVPGEESAPDAAELQSYVKGRLARYKVPRDVVFLQKLPRNATGKLLRHELDRS